MKHYIITFEADPVSGCAPWSGRESSEQKMKQSLYDYLTQRCEARNVIVADAEEAKAVVSTAPLEALNKARGRR